MAMIFRVSIIAIFSALLGMFLMQGNGVLTQKLIKKISSGKLFLLSVVVLSIECGALREYLFLSA
ncbi:hypothetical protein [Thalassomonas haliotis]|uniref:Uncharacterized protein n=1 Tax=Thalassomonas haliotis TaxID=485448 RepID=A0ABY7VC02_9GAMM|nr:hypothetical protein [Thalassomonas haliotis]WDE10629.1 hypothetical protein H3N35_20570 [Thalassomonas haliotis]